MRALTFNAWEGQDETDDRGPGDLRDNVRALIRAADYPEVVSLQEVTGWLERVPDYREVRAPVVEWPHREARAVQLLVRDDMEMVGFRRFRRALGGDWVGPKHGRRHPPRVFPLASFREPGADWAWDVVGVHRTRKPWSLNGAAYHGEHRVLVDWANDRPRGPMVFLGDHNGDDAARELAKAVDGVWRLRRVDGVVARGATIVGQRVVPGRWGGDGHPAVVTRLIARPRT